ncbi:uncharacterized protein N7458_002559 [Penicillium daleae]|uniref:Uncharacterized protein n=1 Tax=Penicillium daleae TaxID=63821 RepID=A0AAD6CDA3_9EURO|nr:uncharacterized protein N7458_002515 [Penicillium daleae]XP_056770049.1 uncharacterized protein N7458_002559 [Penicillium daleae]KAJ5460963.1 hypothetical protein N7458_002515 [Penicillium daleae]KAJ5461007.1 hypothetical protein N7458_002559 [Penicillium daleae]
MKLQRALEEDRTRLDRVRSDPGALGDPFELERTRRSAAPSPEAFLGDDRGEIQEKLLGNEARYKGQNEQKKAPHNCLTA